MKFYLKALIQASSAFIAAVVPALALAGGSTVTPDQWVNAGILGLGAFGVYLAPNVPGANYTKVGIAALTAGMTVWASAFTGGISLIEIIQIAAAVFAAIGVEMKKNEQPEMLGRHSVDNVRVSG